MPPNNNIGITKLYTIILLSFLTGWVSEKILFGQNAIEPNLFSKAPDEAGGSLRIGKNNQPQEADYADVDLTPPLPSPPSSMLVHEEIEGSSTAMPISNSTTDCDPPGSKNKQKQEHTYTGEGEEPTTNTSTSTIEEQIILHNNSSTVPPAGNTDDSSSNRDHYHHPVRVCQELNQQKKSAAEIWVDNFDRILEASRHPNDKEYTLQNHYKSMLLALPPSMLRSALKSRPKASDLKRLLDKVERRRIDPENNPPLIVLVMGGSVTEGSHCKEPDISNGRGCAWSFRLGEMMNQLFGFDAIHVVNIASGGTSSAQGVAIVKYWLYPDSILPHGPDIIVNAYGANDSNVWSASSLEEMERFVEVTRKTFEGLNAFVNAIHSSHGCPPPLIFHLDDYVGGHSQGGIFGDLAYNMMMTQIAKWYGNFAVSSADVVRQVIYANSTETIFSPKWMLNGRTGRYKEECHFGASGHLMIAWAYIYSILEVVTSFCGDESARPSLEGKIDVTTEEIIFPDTLELIQNTPPPPLDPGLMLESVSNKWSSSVQEQQNHCSNSGVGKPCSFAWVAGPEGATSNQNKLQRYLQPYIASNDGWKTEQDMSHGWSRKLGLVATKIGASIDFVVDNIESEIKTITINSLKSYGEKWEGSMARVIVYVKDPENQEFEEVKKFDIEGFHDSNTSVSYTNFESLDKRFAKIGSTLKVNVSLVGGTTFKIVGMMFCRF